MIHYSPIREDTGFEIRNHQSDYIRVLSVVTDWAPGFISLTKDGKDLRDLHIKIVLKDQLNRNYNAVVDRACQDIENEIRKLAPEGRKLSPSTVAKATISVNTILTRKQGICI